jgi:hypothetical protein
MRCYESLPYGWYLECTTAGTTGSSDITIPSPLDVGDTVTDGTVVWTIRKIGSGDGFAIGDIKQIAHNGTIQDGWLECDGRAVSRAMFPDLFACIGTTYGAGDGSTTFNLPNYSDGKFPEGSTVAGVVKQPGLPNIEGNVYAGRDNGIINNDGGAFSGAFARGTSRQNVLTASSAPGNDISFNASLSNPIYGASNTVQVYSCTTRFIIKAYDGVTPTPSQADISEMLTELTGKADRRLSNLDTANLACHVVVDSYYDDTTGDWYRVYDDGWVEQGGVVASTGSGSKTITFLKPFADTNYYINNVGTNIIDNVWDNTSSATYSYAVAACGGVNSLTTTSFKMAGLFSHAWSACGMGAQS